MSADLKTGQLRNYREQMAAYALGFMEATFRTEWTSHLLFCDQQQLVTHRFTYAETKALVEGVIARFNDSAKQPLPCDYWLVVREIGDMPGALATRIRRPSAHGAGVQL